MTNDQRPTIRISVTLSYNVEGLIRQIVGNMLFIEFMPREAGLVTECIQLLAAHLRVEGPLCLVRAHDAAAGAGEGIEDVLPVPMEQILRELNGAKLLNGEHFV